MNYREYLVTRGFVAHSNNFCHHFVANFCKLVDDKLASLALIARSHLEADLGDYRHFGDSRASF